MNREEFIAKLQMVYVGDRNALNEIVGVYDNYIAKKIKEGINETTFKNLMEERKENQRLNNEIKVLLKENEAKEKVIIKQDNVLNELKEWFKEFHKYQSRLKWNEEDYIEFIKHLENELKESDK